MRFYPQGAEVPTERRTDEFLLRPLRTTDVELDYAAVMSSQEMLRRWGGGSWPADDFTLEDNLKDLEWHEAEHLAGEAFTFTVMNLAETECLGCVYVNPLTRLLRWAQVSEGELAKLADYQAVVRFWIKQPRLAGDLDKRLLDALIGWFESEWAFSRVYFRTNERDERQMRLLTEAGFEQRYTLDVPDRAGKHVVYCCVG